MRRNVLVVGMPRSGTSMVASIFANRGYHVAQNAEDDVRDGDRHNPGGYWEAESLIERNVEVFEAAGFPHHNTWLYDPIPDGVAGRIRELDPLPGHEAFVRSFEGESPWLWKDPRLCYTLAYWWKLLDGERTRVLLTSREPESIYRSFIRLGWREPSAEAREDVHRRIEGHVEAARRAVRELDIPHLVAAYDGFADDPEGMAERISAFVGLELSADDLPFDRRYDHSTLRGHVGSFLRRRLERLPPGLKAAVRRVVPSRLLAALGPTERG